jgi:hypothetical protein
MGTSAFADAPSLDHSDPTAKALGYVTQSASVQQDGASAGEKSLLEPGRRIVAFIFVTTRN